MRVALVLALVTVVTAARAADGYGPIAPMIGADNAGQRQWGDGAPIQNAAIQGGGITIAAGRVYVADSYHHAVRGGLFGGVMQRFMGTYAFGSAGDGGLPTDAQITTPYDVAVAPNGALYVVEGPRLRIATSAMISTGLAGLASPTSVAVNADGSRVFVADMSRNHVVACPLPCPRTGCAGCAVVAGGGSIDGGGSPGAGGDGGPATAATLTPQGIALCPDDSLVIADSAWNRVRKVTNGLISTIGGSGGSPGTSQGWVDGPAAGSKFNKPQDVACPETGVVFVADTQNYRVRQIAGGQVTTIMGTGQPWTHTAPASDPLQQAITMPNAVAADATQVLVGSWIDGVVWRIGRGVPPPIALSTATQIAFTPTLPACIATATVAPTGTPQPICQ